MKSNLWKIVPPWLITQRLSASAKGCVLLTFDDGPDPEVTPRVLQLLDEYRARAVFFLIGNRIHRAPHLPKDIQIRGHLVGNHTFCHHDHDVLDDCKPSPFREFLADVVKCQAKLGQLVGRPPRLFRAPGGRTNVNSLVAPLRLGLKSVAWSLEINDWQFRTREEARAGAEQLINSVQSGDIVVLHDDNPCVVDVLEQVLPELVSRGFDLANGIEFL